MSGIFPNGPDGGLPPNAASPNNPAQAYDPIRDPVGTSALYYGNGCEVRLRPEVVNSLISCVEAVVDAGEVTYDPGRLTNLLLGIQYLMQRGRETGVTLVGGPAAYTGTLIPPVTSYNDFMMLKVVPGVNNTGPVTVNLNGVGAAQVLRNDGLDLKADDFRANIPVIIIALGGKFYVPYLVQSQVPILLVGAVDAWVRTDGNDTTGDGTANTAAKAFRTINRAFQVLGGKYLQTPLFTMNIRLGIPGTYEAFKFDNFGGNVTLVGDPANPSQYRIAGQTTGTERYSGAVIRTAAQIQGVTFVMDSPAPTVHWALAVSGSAVCTLYNCRFEVTMGNNKATFVVISANGFVQMQGSVVIDGGAGTYESIISCQSGGIWNGGLAGTTLTFNNLTAALANLDVRGVSQFTYSGTTVTATNTHGPKYLVAGNSLLSAGSQPIPGDVPGTLASGGQLV